MADTATRARRFTIPEFLEWEERQEVKHELIDGVPRAMSGANRGHNTVAGNIFSVLRSKLRGGRCMPFNSDFKVITDDGRSFYPDVTVDCGTGPNSQLTAVEPTVVFEVLSPSTREFDFETKLPSYQATPAIRQIVFVEPDRPHLTTWLRTAEGWTQREVVAPEEGLALEPLNLLLTFAEIYEDVAVT